MIFSSGLRPVYNITITGNSGTGIRDSNGTEWRMRRLERELSFDQDQVLLMKKKVRPVPSIHPTASARVSAQHGEAASCAAHTHTTCRAGQRRHPPAHIQ